MNLACSMFRSVYQIHRVVFSACGSCGEAWWWRSPNAVRGTRALSLSWAHYKKRKTAEERQAEREGRRVIRYSPKMSPDKVVGIWRNMSVQEVAQVLKKDTEHVLDSLFFADKDPNARYNEQSIIHNQEVLRMVVKLSGLKFKLVAPPHESVVEEKNRDATPAPPAPPENLRPRPPVVCVMGHVDHGKTTLLDALRDTSVVDTEFGGITQHIGAFSVQLPTGEKVTFLDTPGHAAFSAMRSRGAHATDIVLLVVAADDGVMEQTVQSIRMARDADVPILVAVNKMDKPGVSPKRSLDALATHGVIAESLGGDVQAIPVSAKARTNLNTLVEALSLQAQLMELKADPTGYVEGVVVEAQLDPTRGKQATVLVRRGTLRRGCVLVAGTGWAKTRVLLGSDGNTLSEAPPATPVRVLGWRELPAAGDLLLEVESEKRAHEVMKWRAKKQMEEKQSEDAEAIRIKEAEHQVQYRAYVERKRALGRFKLRREGPKEKEIKEDTHPTLRVLFKGDVDGSVEAILDVMDTYDEHEVVRLDIVHFGVGPVSPSDIDIAEAFKAVVYTFNVDITAQLEAEAENRGVTIKHHNVIYKMIDDIKEEINVRIPMRQEEEVIGEANVLQPFMITEKRKKVCVAGSRCVKGSLLRNALYRIIRRQDIIFEGQISSMKHLKNEVDTIKKDMECGIRFSSEDLEVQPGDTIICYRMVDAPTTTQWDPGF